MDREARQARWANTTFFFLLGIVFGSWVARLPAVQNRLGLDDAQLGIALLSVTVGAILAMPATGWLIHHRGNDWVMRAAAAVLCLSLLLLPLAPSMSALMLALFVFGIGFGLLDVSMNTHAVIVEERYARPIMSTFHGVFSVGGLAGAASAGTIAELGVPPFPHLLMAGALSLAVPAFTGEARLRRRDARGARLGRGDARRNDPGGGDRIRPRRRRSDHRFPPRAGRGRPRAGLFLVAVRCLVGALLAGTVRRVERPHINE